MILTYVGSSYTKVSYKQKYAHHEKAHTNNTIHTYEIRCCSNVVVVRDDDYCLYEFEKKPKITIDPFGLFRIL